jgi:hypothetical protein
MKPYFTLKTPLILLFAVSLFLGIGCKKDAPPARDKFLGSYQVNENCTTGTYSYSLSIVESASSLEGVIIQNFGNFQSTINVNAIVSGDNLTFNATQDGVTITGSGSINGNTLTIIYQAAGSFEDSCTSTCIKQ